MSSTTTTVVTPRSDGEPEVDLTGYRLAHRAAIEDTRAVADLADQVTGSRLRLTPVRSAALRGYVVRLCTEIRFLQDAEDRLVWPVVAASAASALDLSDLRDDHRVIDPLLVRARSAAVALHETPEDGAVACRLAGTMTDLSALLAEHAADEERELFPCLQRFVSVADFAACSARVRREVGARRLTWVLPWVAHHASGEELARAVRSRRAHALLAVGSPRFRRARAAALGSG